MSNGIIKCYQANLQKAYLGQVEVNNKIEGQGDFLLLIQESYIPHGKLAGMPSNTTLVPSNTAIDKPRAALCAARSLKLTEVTELCTRDLAVGIINDGRKPFAVASAYLDINLPVAQDCLNRLALFCKTNKLGLLLAMYTNAHSTLFGPTQNARGSALEDVLMNLDLEIINNSHVPTFRCARGKSCIDLTVTHFLEREVNGWDVDTGYNGSDHSTISYSVTCQATSNTMIRDWDKADWTSFSTTLSKD